MQGQNNSNGCPEAPVMVASTHWPSPSSCLHTWDWSEQVSSVWDNESTFMMYCESCRGFLRIISSGNLIKPLSWDQGLSRRAVAEMGLETHFLSHSLVLLPKDFSLKKTMKYALLEDKCRFHEVSSIDKRQNNNKILIMFWKPLNSSQWCAPLAWLKPCGRARGSEHLSRQTSVENLPLFCYREKNL